MALAPLEVAHSDATQAMASPLSNARVLSVNQPKSLVTPALLPTEAYVAIDLDGLIVDSILDFNLYIPAGPGRFVLFRSTSLGFTIEHRNRLLENGVRTLYVKADEKGQYQKYLEQNIGAVLSNPEIAPKKKASMLYSVSRTVVQDALTEPRSSEIVPRTRRIATETVDYVLRNDRALVELASIMATDYYTYTHSINVCVFVTALANHAGVDRTDVHELAVGALLHDVGKSQVPKAILTKNGPLTNEEFAIMRQHVEWGAQLLRQHGRLSSLSMIPVLQHHEKLDASGYPYGLGARDIHLFGRISAIADVFDAMTTNRSYQQAMTAFEALQRMKLVLTGKFDQELLVKFIGMLRKG
jgi:putative nucleotidyltransferase with HDIG domain